MPSFFASARHPLERSREPLRLLLVDDSLVARAALRALLAERPEFVVAGAARSVAEAQAILAAEPVDIVLLDLQMPGRDGLDALPDLLAAGRGARVLVVSGTTADGGRAAVQALTLGAADTIRKPAAGELGPRFAAQLAERLLRIGAARRGSGPARLPAMPSRRLRSDPVGCVAIGASTGGLTALSAALRALPPAFAAPILVTQHLPAEFMPYFVQQLGGLAARPARLADDGMPLRAGEILVAPGHAHLVLRRDAGRGLPTVALEHAPAVSGCRPSVDPMFEGVAATFGAAGVGIVLSGMGRDGALGAAALVQAGGEVLAQDAASAAIWGMPGAVAQAGLAAAVLPPAALAAHLTMRGSAAAWN